MVSLSTQCCLHGCADCHPRESHGTATEDTCPPPAHEHSSLIAALEGGQGYLAITSDIPTAASLVAAVEYHKAVWPGGAYGRPARKAAEPCARCRHTCTKMMLTLLEQ